MMLGAIQAVTIDSRTGSWPPTTLHRRHCTDDTEEIARRTGAGVFVTVDNRSRTAGGLILTLARFLPQADAAERVLMMGAATVLGPSLAEPVAH